MRLASGGDSDTEEHREHKQSRGDRALYVPRLCCGSDEAAIQACAREAYVGGKSAGRPLCAERHDRGYAANPQAPLWGGAFNQAACTWALLALYARIYNI